MNVEATLVKGRGGVFEVELDGELLFSKKREGRFPEAGEIVALLAPRLAVPPG